MKQIITKKLMGLMLVFGLMAAPAPLALVPAGEASAACTGIECAKQGAKNVKTGGADSDTVPEVFETVTNILLYLIGAVAVVMLVIGGFKYVTSNGNAEQIKSAKNTIMYAVVGIVVAIIAFAAVNWVIDSLT